MRRRLGRPGVCEPNSNRGGATLQSLRGDEWSPVRSSLQLETRRGEPIRRRVRGVADPALPTPLRRCSRSRGASRSSSSRRAARTCRPCSSRTRCNPELLACLQTTVNKPRTLATCIPSAMHACTRCIAGQGQLPDGEQLRAHWRPAQVPRVPPHATRRHGHVHPSACAPARLIHNKSHATPTTCASHSIAFPLFSGCCYAATRHPAQTHQIHRVVAATSKLDANCLLAMKAVYSAATTVDEAKADPKVAAAIQRV